MAPSRSPVGPADDPESDEQCDLCGHPFGEHADVEQFEKYTFYVCPEATWPNHANRLIGNER